MSAPRTFFVPGHGMVTLHPGETCPEQWREFAGGSANDQAPDSEAAALALAPEAPAVTDAPATDGDDSTTRRRR